MTAPRPPANTAADKKVVLEALLATGDIVRVRLDARYSGVEVPARFRADASLLLELGYSMRIPMPDLDVGWEGVDVTLSFGGVPSPVFLPWGAIYAMQGVNGSAVWVESIPPELLAEAAPTAPAAAAPGGSVVDLMSRRTPRDQRAVRARLAGLPQPQGGDAA